MSYQRPFPEDENRHPVPSGTTITHTTRAVASTSAQATLSGSAKLVRLVADVDCYVDFGTNPVATTSKMFLPAHTIDYVPVANFAKLAAVRATADGTLYIMEIA